MKKRTLSLLIICGLAACVMVDSAYAGKGKGFGRTSTVPVTVLTPAEAEDLLFLREEEKLARDVYVTFYGVWKYRIFNNIAKSEQRHMDAVLGLMNIYGLADPVLEFGLFANPELQELFDTLVADGAQAELDALMIGALIEEVDIEDLVSAMQRTSNSRILAVYLNLLAGSENHLRAFVRNIELLTGESYVAQVIPQEDVDAILAR